MKTFLSIEKMTQVFDAEQPAVKTDTGSAAVFVMMNHRRVTVMEADPANPDGPQVEVVKHEYDVVRLVPESKDEAIILAAVKQMVVDEITAYDSSDAVNGFYLNGNEMWIPRELRNELTERIAREEARGHETVPFDYNGQEITLPINDDVKTMLEELKYYADDCYTQTQRHKAAIAAKRTVNTVLAYDYTQEYPEKPSFTLSK